MWDHIFFGPSYVVDTVTHSWIGNTEYAAAATEEYITSRSGILTNVGGDLLGKLCNMLVLNLDRLTRSAFQNLPNGSISAQTAQDLVNEFGTDWPNIEFLSLDAYTGSLSDFLLDAPTANNFTSVCIAAVSPFSRGNVTIASNDTNVHPIVNPNWLGDPRDQEIAVAAFKQARAVFEAPAVKPVLIGDEAFPGKNVTTDEQILNVVQTSSSTIHHAAGTCKMGLTNDTMAVVDSQGMF
jgi:choline dehydrogenase